MKRVLYKICIPLSLIVGIIAFVMAQGSFAWWKQPRIPKTLKQ